MNFGERLERGCSVFQLKMMIEQRYRDKLSFAEGDPKKIKYARKEKKWHYRELERAIHEQFIQQILKKKITANS